MDPNGDIHLRVVFSALSAGGRDKWHRHLAEAGVAILHASARGFDVSGPSEVLERALHIRIDASEGRPLIVTEPEQEDDRDLERPLSVYMPNAPTYF